MKRLSVIIPGYNNPEWRWRRCLESVLAAIGSDDEVICVDDGSAVGKVISDCAGLKAVWEDERIRVLCLPQNQGQAAARNAGLDVARGEYVTFVDSDDAVKGQAYDACIQKLEETGVDVAVYGVNVIWAAEGLQKHDLPAAADVESLHRANLFNYAVNKVVRKRFLDEHQIRFDVDGMPCEDVMFYLQTVLDEARWCAVPLEGYVYYLNANGSQVTNYERRFVKGTTAAAQMWAKYCAAHPDASPYLRKLALTEDEIVRGEWGNIWKKGSPYSLVGRWRWLVDAMQRGRCGYGNPVCEFVKMALRTFVRRYLYVRPLRRRHYKSLYANVERVRG